MSEKILRVFIDESGSFSASELEFYDNVRDFKKNYLKHIKKKLL